MIDDENRIGDDSDETIKANKKFGKKGKDKDGSR